MFTAQDKDFLSRKMSMDVGFIESKLQESSIKEYNSDAVDLISSYISMVKGINVTGKLLNPISVTVAFNEIFISTISKISQNNKTEIYKVLDSIRHAFCSFATGGLVALYTQQEYEDWYPKIKINEIIEPNDISSLPEKFIIYRGCDVSELNSKVFGQSWSTSPGIAEMFAYKQYKNEAWFNIKNRIVLTAEYTRDDVFYSSCRSEFEVVVNIHKLKNVKRHNN